MDGGRTHLPGDDRVPSHGSGVMGSRFSLHTLVDPGGTWSLPSSKATVFLEVGGWAQQRVGVPLITAGTPGMPPLPMTVRLPPPFSEAAPAQPPGLGSPDLSNRYAIFSVPIMALCPMVPEPAQPPLPSSGRPRRVNGETALGAGTPLLPAHHCPTCSVS